MDWIGQAGSAFGTWVGALPEYGRILLVIAVLVAMLICGIGMAASDGGIVFAIWITFLIIFWIALLLLLFIIAVATANGVWWIVFIFSIILSFFILGEDGPM